MGVIKGDRSIVRKNSTGSEFINRRLNMIEGSNIALTVASDSTNNEVDITVAVRDQIFNVKSYGAVGDGSTDDTTAIQAAIDAAAALTNGGVVFFPSGEYYSGTLTLKNKVSLLGYRGSSKLKLKNSSGTLIISENFATNAGSGDPYEEISQFFIDGLTIDGNSGNQTDSAEADYRERNAIIKIYGWNFRISNVRINNSKEIALYTEHDNAWSDTFNDYEFGESIFENIYIKNYGKVGWVNRGPHDSYIKAVYISSSNDSGLTAQYGYVGEANANTGELYSSVGAVIDNMHIWGTHSSNAVYINGGTITQGKLYAEGATGAAIYLATGNNHFEAMVGYAATGIEINANNNNNLDIIVESNISGYACKLNGASGGNIITSVRGFGTSGVFELSSYTGSNNTLITARPYDTADLISGTPATSDRLDFTNDNFPEADRETQWELPVKDTKFKITSAAGVDAGGLDLKNVNILEVDAALRTAVVTLTDGATPALDASLGNHFVLTAAGNRTIAVPSNPTNGQTITIEHIASGGARTLGLNTGAGGFAYGTDIPALTETASGLTDYIKCIYNSTAGKWRVIAYVKGF